MMYIYIHVGSQKHSEYFEYLPIMITTNPNNLDNPNNPNEDTDFPVEGERGALARAREREIRGLIELDESMSDLGGPYNDPNDPTSPVNRLLRYPSLEGLYTKQVRLEQVNKVI